MDRTSSKNWPEIRGPGSVVICVRRFIQGLLRLFWAYHPTGFILALRMAPSASHHWESLVQNPEPQHCPCVCVNGAWHQRERLSPTGGTKSNSPSGTSRPPLHHSSRPSRIRPHPLIPKLLPRNGNVAMICSLASYGEQKMHVVSYVHHPRWAHTHTSSIVVGRERLVKLATTRA